MSTLNFGVLSCKFMTARIDPSIRRSGTFPHANEVACSKIYFHLLSQILFAVGKHKHMFQTFADSCNLLTKPDTAGNLSITPPHTFSHFHALTILHFSHSLLSPCLPPLLSPQYPTPALIPPPTFSLTSLLILIRILNLLIFASTSLRATY